MSNRVLRRGTGTAAAFIAALVLTAGCSANVANLARGTQSGQTPQIPAQGPLMTQLGPQDRPRDNQPLGATDCGSSAAPLGEAAGIAPAGEGGGGSVQLMISVACSAVWPEVQAAGDDGYLLNFYRWPAGTASCDKLAMNASRTLTSSLSPDVLMLGYQPGDRFMAELSGLAGHDTRTACVTAP